MTSSRNRVRSYGESAAGETITFTTTPTTEITSGSSASNGPSDHNDQNRAPRMAIAYKGHVLDYAPDARVHRLGMPGDPGRRVHAPFPQGVGPYDATVLGIPLPQRQARIDSELRRLERAHIELLIDALGPLAPTYRAAHFGRSPDIVRELKERFGCVVDQWRSFGANVEHARHDAVVDEEIRSTSDLFAHCATLARVVRPRGRCVFTALSINDGADRDCREVTLLREQFGIIARPRATYFAALTSNGFVPDIVADMTRQAVPYWELRHRSAGHTTLDRVVLSGYLGQTVCLLLVAAERFSSQASPGLPHRLVAAPVAPVKKTNPTAHSSVSFGLRYY